MGQNANSSFKKQSHVQNKTLAQCLKTLPVANTCYCMWCMFSQCEGILIYFDSDRDHRCEETHVMCSRLLTVHVQVNVEENYFARKFGSDKIN